MKTFITYLAFILTSCSVFAVSKTSENSRFVPGEFLVKIRSNVSASSKSLQSLSQILGSHVKSQVSEDRWFLVTRPLIESPESALEILSNKQIVEYAEPNFLFHLTNTPNDEYFAEQWGLKNIGQKDGKKRTGLPGMDIGAEQAWDITTGSKDVIVAIIDTGIGLDHPEFLENLWTNQAELNGKVGVDDDGNGYVDDIHGYSFEAGKENGNPQDDVGHGSHCAGIIGAKGNNGKGVVGVNWNVRLMPLKFIGASGEGSSEAAIRAIDYAIKNGARILSNSWGGGDDSQALRDAIERANRAGILFIAASGNDHANNDEKPFFPATYPIENIIAVTAIDNNGRLADFANFGNKTVHVGAPGVNIASTVQKEYLIASGTSMAAPFVSGVAALVLAHEPTLTHLELKNRIINTTKPISGLQGKTHNRGLVNAYNALMNIQTTPTSEDPSTWKNEYPLNIKTEHPYLNRTNQKFEVRVPGAKQFSIFFSRLWIETGFDIAYIKDTTGKIVDKVTGRSYGVYSAPIDGDFATIEFTSDRDINDWGFDITKAVWR